MQGPWIIPLCGWYCWQYPCVFMFLVYGSIHNLVYRRVYKLVYGDVQEFSATLKRKLQNVGRKKRILHQWMYQNIIKLFNWLKSRKEKLDLMECMHNEIFVTLNNTCLMKSSLLGTMHAWWNLRHSEQCMHVEIFVTPNNACLLKFSLLRTVHACWNFRYTEQYIHDEIFITRNNPCTMKSSLLGTMHARWNLRYTEQGKEMFRPIENW